MRKVFVAFLVAGALASGAPSARAGLIASPALNLNESGYTSHGIDFTVVTDCVLTGFSYLNQGKADTVQLTLVNGLVLQSLSVGAGHPTFAASGLNWSLTAGTEYRLMAHTTANGKYGAYTVPVSNGDLRVNSGVFGGFANPYYWADFTGLATQPVTAAADPAPAAVPEPATVAVLGLMALGGAGYARRRKGTPTT